MKTWYNNGIIMLRSKTTARTAIIAAAFILLAFSFSAFAETQCLTSVSTSTSTSRATTGTSVSVTVATVGSSCTISTLSFVSSPSLTVNDPSSGQYSGFSAGTSKSFAVAAGTAGTYTYYARGTTTAGSVDSTSQILEFVSPSDLTVTPSPSSASITSGNSFNLTINVQNPQTSDISTSYTLNIPSGLTRQAGDPASSSATTISASSTKALVFEIRHSTCFTGSKTITFDLGGSTGAASVAVTGNSSCTSTTNTTTTTSSSSSSGSSSSSSSSDPSYVITVAQMTPDSTADVAIKNSNIAVNRIFTNVKSTVQNVKVNVTKLSSRPSYISAAPDGTIYQYNDVTLTNLAASNINSANLRFNVTKSWLTANGYDYSHVSLYRYTDKWSKLTTTKISESSASYEFEANTPGFSVFVIAAYKQAVTTPEANVTTPPANETGVGTGTGTQTNKTQEQAGTQANKTQEQAAPKTETGIGTAISQDIMYVILVILVAAVLFVIYSVMLKKKTAGYEYKAKK